jgi:hypothetical protein
MHHTIQRNDPSVQSATERDFRPSAQRLSQHVTGYLHSTFIPTAILGSLCPSWASGGVLWLVNSSLSRSETAWKMDACWKSRMAGSILDSALLLGEKSGRYKRGPNGSSKRRYVNTICQRGNVGCEVLNISIFRDTIFGSPLEVYRYFGGACRLNLQGPRISKGWDQPAS